MSLTDLELLKETFTRLKIEFTTEEPDWAKKIAATNYVSIFSGAGYAGFGATFYFDKNGKFVEHGIWE